MRRYELRFVTEDGRLIRGPIFNKDGMDDGKGIIRDIHGMSVFRMTFGNQYKVIPTKTLEKGHMEIKPVGLLYFLIRAWRAR